MIGDLDSGKRFGLPPIGLPGSNLDTSGSDTERRAFPGLATKSSVFAWTIGNTLVPLLSRTNVTGLSVVDTISFRQNLATGGQSVDVPTWAAGAVVMVWSELKTLGTSSYFTWRLYRSIGSQNNYFMGREDRGPNVAIIGDYRLALVPFYDEPTVDFEAQTDGTGTSNYTIWLHGFVRNV